MNRNLLIALTLPSMMFYQSNAPILYSSEKLIAQVKEEQAMRTFDLSDTGNTLIVSNDRIEEKKESTASAEIVEPDQSTDHSQGRENSTSGAKENTYSEQTETSKTTGVLPKTNQKAAEHKKNSSEVLETIEQKISALPITVPSSDKNGERELVRMLASMSGTILYGTKMTETNRQDYIIF